MQRHRTLAAALLALLVLAPRASCLARAGGSSESAASQRAGAGPGPARPPGELVPFGQHAAAQRQLQRAAAAGRQAGGCSDFTKEFVSQYARENTVLVTVVDILVMKWAACCCSSCCCCRSSCCRRSSCCCCCWAHARGDHSWEGRGCGRSGRRRLPIAAQPGPRRRAAAAPPPPQPSPGSSQRTARQPPPPLTACRPPHPPPPTPTHPPPAPPTARYFAISWIKNVMAAGIDYWLMGAVDERAGRFLARRGVRRCFRTSLGAQFQHGDSGRPLACCCWRCW
jgi:hypothetical protein